VASNTPAAEVDIDEVLVRELLIEQQPDLADLPLTLMANGWDNVIFRLGDDFVVQMPRREIVAPQMRNLQRWLPELAPSLPLPISAPVRAGTPGCGYPWPWIVCPWLPGAPALAAPPDDLNAAAVALGEFVRALRQPAPEDAPAPVYRGGPLVDRDPALRERVAQLGGSIDGTAVLRRWGEYLAVPRWPYAATWLHGDLHSGNILVNGGRVSAVIDFVDLAAGDPACDLLVAWTLFSSEERLVFRDAADVDDATWARGQGWALSWAIAVLAGSADNPAYADLGRRTLREVLGG
jgi:aminoglycoside phosphotransferase (APT) family kinase protein